MELISYMHSGTHTGQRQWIQNIWSSVVIMVLINMIVESPDKQPDLHLLWEALQSEPLSPLTHIIAECGVYEM